MLRNVHDFILEQFEFGDSEFGLKPGLAKRELGGEMVCLTEMWLDGNDKSMIVMSEVGKVSAQIVDMEVQAKKIWMGFKIWKNACSIKC